MKKLYLHKNQKSRATRSMKFFMEIVRGRAVSRFYKIGKHSEPAELFTVGQDFPLCIICFQISINRTKVKWKFDSSFIGKNHLSGENHDRLAIVLTIIIYNYKWTFKIFASMKFFWISNSSSFVCILKILRFIERGSLIQSLTIDFWGQKNHLFSSPLFPICTNQSFSLYMLKICRVFFPH